MMQTFLGLQQNNVGQTKQRQHGYKCNDIFCLSYLMPYKMHRCIRHTPISAGQIKKKQRTNIKCDIMNIINDNTFNLHNSLLYNNNGYIKVTLRGVAR